MVAVVPVRVPGEAKTWTVLGTDHLPIPPVEEYLEYLRLNRSSPNTIESYARSLRLFWEFLEIAGSEWDALLLADFAGFVRWLRTGARPDVATIGPFEEIRAPSTVATRVAAVLSFYRYQFDAHDVEVVNRLYRRSVTSSRNHSRYVGFLGHLHRTNSSVLAQPMFKARIPRRDRTPMMTPAECSLILRLSGPAVDDGSALALRDRLLFTTLWETGMRLGECLCLQHRDWSTGSGVTPFIDLTAREDHPHGYRCKSGVGRRLYVSDDLAALYGEYLWRLCDEGAADRDLPLEEDWVFVNLRGTANSVRYQAMKVDTVYDKVASIKARGGNGVPAGFTPHWFRHTHASTLLLAGVKEHVVMRRLGHRQVQTTLETYGWVTEDAELALLANWRQATKAWRVQQEK